MYVYQKYTFELKKKCNGIGTENYAVVSSEINCAVQEILKVAKHCPNMIYSLNNSQKLSNIILAC